MPPPETTHDLSPEVGKSGADHEKWGRSGADSVALDRRLLIKERDAVHLLSMSVSTLKRQRDHDHFPGNQARQFGATWFYAPDVLRDEIKEYWATTTWQDSQENGNDS
jgi:hypothetical protein